MTISIIIPNYNGFHLIHKNLPQVIHAAKKYSPAIIIVDDRSDEKDFALLSDFVKSLQQDQVPIHLFRNKKNYGFSKTVNVGISQAESELVVLLNSDVVPNENFLDAIVPHFENQDVCAVGCLEKSSEKGTPVLNGRGEGKFERGFLIHKRGAIDKDNTLWVSGGSSVFRRSLLQKLGGFDELYSPFYWEDIDLSYRAQKSGYKVLFEKTSIVEHRHEEGAIKSNFSPAHVKKIAYRNQILFVWKNITDRSYLLQHFCYLPLHIVRAIISGDWAFLKGVAAALFLIPVVYQKRRESSQLFVRTDHDVLLPFQS